MSKYKGYIKYIKVRNMKNTSDNKIPSGYESWKDYWESKKGRKFGTCSEESCTAVAKHGAHVMVNGESLQDASELEKLFGTKGCIVPLCAEHNNYSNDSAFYVKESDLVKII